MPQFSIFRNALLMIWKVWEGCGIKVPNARYANGVPLYEIQRSLGHSTQNTTLGYLFNPYSEEDTNKLIETTLH